MLSTTATFAVLLATTITAGTASTGCVLPDTLTEEGSTPTNHQPVIISGRPTDFNAGKIAKSKSDLWSWGVTVRDGAAPGTVTLEGRLFYQDVTSGPLHPLGRSIALAATADDPTLYSGDALAAQDCQSLTGDVFFYVYVSDETWPMTGLVKDLDAGHYDYKAWVVSCQ